jgi:intein-encoded DNA endonuclease-like protein
MISQIQKAYIAGFLDGDGSVFVQAKSNATYKYDYQISPYIVLYQSAKNKDCLKNIQSILNIGTIRSRNDGMEELIINKINDIRFFLQEIGPYSFAKKKQLELMAQIIDAKETVEKKEDFKHLLKLIDAYSTLNYSKRRILHP